MHEPPADSDQPRRDWEIPARSGRLAGSYSQQEREEREQAHWEHLRRAGRRALFVRVVVSAVVLFVLGGVIVARHTLRSREFHAEKYLKRIRMELELQQTLIFRKVPLNTDESLNDAEIKRTLDNAFGDLISDDLEARRNAIPIVQGILAPRIPRAMAEMKSEFPALAGKLRRDLDESQAIIADRKRKYNAAARDYNKAVVMFPCNLFHGVLGYPDRLQTLK